MNGTASFLAERGVRSRIARAIGISHQAVTKWLETGVPYDKVLIVCQLEAWTVTPHELRPDLYPHPEDGLPEALRERLRRRGK